MSNNLGRFRSNSEKEYFKLRSKLLKKSNSEFIANNPFLFVTRQEISDMLVRVKLFEKIKNISGYIIECGSNNGMEWLVNRPL